MKFLSSILIVLMPIMSIAQNQTKSSDKLAVYQIFTRLFANQNTTNKFNGTLEENGTAKFKDINKNALKSIKELGISHVWYTGIIEHATMSDFSKFGIKKDHPQVVKGIAGSPYAIKDYYDVNPYLAENVENRMTEFKDLVKRTHELDLKVIIDFVPNHVSREYNSDVKPQGITDFGEKDDKSKTFNSQNNFYYLPNQAFEIPEGVNPPVAFKEKYSEFPAKATGNDVFSAKPSINDWFETLKLNYGVDYLNGRTTHFDPIPDTWLKMKDILAYWSAKGVDGFRCDMAEMVPVEFWGWVIPEIKAINPKVIFIAEIYNPNEYGNYLFKGKFDYLYDKVGLYDALRRLIEGHGNANDITAVWQKESGNFSNRMLRFLENHDEQRIASEEFGKNRESALAAMMLSATLHTGPIMVYYGQELGVKPSQAEGFQGNDGRTTIFDYWGVTELQNWINKGKFDTKKLSKEQKSLREFYGSTLIFAQENPAISDGEFHDLQYLNFNSEGYDSSKVYSYLRYTNEQILLFVYNFDLNSEKNIKVSLPKNVLEKQFGNVTQVKLKQVFEGKEKQKLTIEKSQTDLINIQPNSFKIFEITKP
ncbi:alpha-amylase family protein [Lacihabitans sp. CCS-44]|uniref:alpha-amylase family protein n=1 Tax=Lacihabitans sp. CCS-44 TaxID=2487331 RepID=UPI0038F810FF